MRNTNQYDNMLYSPVPQLIMKLSVPTIISMLVTNIYNLVDTAFVGKLGTSASGAVGIVFGFMAILQAIGFLFGQGSGSIISRKLGQKNVSDASIIASTAFFFAFMFAIIAAIISFIFLDPLVYILGSTTTIAPYAKTYILFILATAPFMVTSFTLNNILRYEGKAFFGMLGLMSGAILNIAGDALFMFKFNMGISGAGLSTALSQIISFLILLASFLSGQTSCKLSIKNIAFNYKKISEIIATGLPSLLRQGLGSLSTIVLNMEAALYGDAAIAAMSIVSRIFFFIFSIAVGVGQGFQPVSGFSYGAQKFDRLKSAYKFTIFFSEILMIILGSIVFFNSSTFVYLLRDDPDVVEIGTRALQLHCLSLLVLPACMATEMLMQSTGQKLMASILSSLRSGILLIPLLIILTPIRGLAGIQESQPIANFLAFLPAIYFSKKFFNNLSLDEIKKE